MLIQFASAIVEHLVSWVVFLTIVNPSLNEAYPLSFHCYLFREFCHIFERS